MLDGFSHSQTLEGGIQGKAREGLAIFINSHDLLTNQIY